jgi:S-methylmethionine-dependent homocysteine/selenocysteine methylase
LPPREPHWQHFQASWQPRLAGKYGCRVAGCLPPLFGSYRPDLFIAEKSGAILEILIKALNPHVDLWLAETLSSIGEAEAVFDALAGDSRKIWVSFTLLEGESALEGKPRLRSGETVVETVRCMIERPASAMLFNCSQPELMAAAIEAAGEEMSRSGRRLPIGVYANAFASPQEDSPANLTISEIRHDIDPAEYADFAASWYDRGATIIGGCCGIGPEHIQALCTKLKKL